MLLHNLTFFDCRSLRSFAFSGAAVLQPPHAGATKDATVEVTVTVTNTGKVASAVTAQVYCSYLDTPQLRVVRWAAMLCGFTKIFLAPQEQQLARVPIALSALARWDTRAAATDLLGRAVAGAYVVDAGRYGVAVGDCSGAAAAAGYAAPRPCAQQRAQFSVNRTLVFAGK